VTKDNREIAIATAIGALVIGGIFALVWFLVFRPVDEQFPEGSEATDAERAAGDPGRVDEAFTDAIAASSPREAYDLMTEAYRQSVPFADFERATAANAHLRSVRSIGCYRTATYERSVHVRWCILDSEAGKADATLHFALEDRSWRINGITIGGLPALPSGPSP
jgi:hypothetical protein